ncbi:MAG TPA: cysteine desulfurase-like protein [Actinomycetota bacterium]|nr:cysteine desulfurase-like protein [Actinomycetota bacterium]
MSALDVGDIKSLYPALRRRVGGGPALYTDAPGGTQVPAPVIQAMVEYLEVSNANEDGAFATSEETGRIVAEARVAAADLLGCGPDEIVFGANMTTLAFALSRVIARELRDGDEVVVTRLDHDANVAPWLAAAEDSGATVRWVDVTTPECDLDLESLDAAIGERTRVVAFTLASNAVGTISRAHEVVARARAAGAVVVADAVHYAPHRLLDVRALDVDFLFCSPYKFFGPHMGIMYGTRALLEKWRPYKVRPASDAVPSSWETGTKSHEALAGLVACVDYLAGLAGAGGDQRQRIEASMAAIERHESALARRFLAGLERVGDVELFGVRDLDAPERRTPTFAVRVPGVVPAEAAARLGSRGIFVWDGNYYALALMERLGLEESGGAVRIGFCHYHDDGDVDRVLDALAELTGAAP